VHIHTWSLFFVVRSGTYDILIPAGNQTENQTFVSRGRSSVSTTDQKKMHRRRKSVQKKSSGEEKQRRRKASVQKKSSEER
jgi:hypothetical protein